MKPIYILFAGEQSKRKSVLVSKDVKLIAKKYVELINENNIPYKRPDVEIWKNEIHIGNFFEQEKNEAKVKKALSKIATFSKEDLSSWFWKEE